MKTIEEIKHEILLGEDSTRQFKEKLQNAHQIAVEMCAMSNSIGGVIYIGVKDNSEINRLSLEEIRLYNQYISAAANEQIKPAIYPQTQTISIDNKNIIIIYVSEGVSKPYCDKDGIYWAKSGSDKRKISPEELKRLFQNNIQLNLDETATNENINQINKVKFYLFFEKLKGSEFHTTELSLEKVLHNMNLAIGNKLSLAGLLLFGNTIQNIKPFCLIKAVCMDGDHIGTDTYIDKQDIGGTLEEQFRGSLNFIKNNLKHIQSQSSFNSAAILEISEKALEEVLVNALLHRDYGINAAIKIFIYKDQVEVVSPGSLTNHLTIENIFNGNSVMRNPLLASYGTKILPYSGLGSGIARIIKNHPASTFMDDKEGRQFKVIMQRNAS
jgi:ATP-dependent DNA helicase RecG